MKLLVVVFFLVAAVLTSNGQTTGFVPATPLKTPKFKLPASAGELTGTISARVAVDDKGNVVAVDDFKGPGDVCPQVMRADVVALRKAVEEAALKTIFTPATTNGIPESSTTRLEFNASRNGSAKTKDEKETEVHFSAAADGQSGTSGLKTVSGGALNQKAQELGQAAYPPAARAVRATGSVPVEVLIDIDGTVFSARASEGHPLLRSTAVAAACRSKFEPTSLSGKPVKVSGRIVYNFVP